MTTERTAPCAKTGFHIELVAGPPQDLGSCINVEQRCADCGTVVVVTSWRKADYLEKFGPRKRDS